MQASIAWASSHSRYTKKFEMMVLDWLRETTIPRGQPSSGVKLERN